MDYEKTPTVSTYVTVDNIRHILSCMKRKNKMKSRSPWNGIKHREPSKPYRSRKL